MKPTHTMVMLAAAVLASCSQPAYYVQPTQMGGMPQDNGAQRRYLALPGQPAVQVGTEAADEAFDRQASAYTQEVTQNMPAAPGAPEATGAPWYDAGVPAVQPVEVPTAVQPADITPAVQPVVQQPVVQQPATPSVATGSADYAVQITNGTTGRIFVEAQDAAGHIFPCGAMFAGQSINTPPDSNGPLKGPITVVIRDPDKPGAPEIRRYKVDPPADYLGKTVGITILPGGQYRADVDNKVYYTSPAPQQPAATPAQ